MYDDHPRQPIDQSMAPLADTLIEARERQRLADMQRISPLLDQLHPERVAQRTQERVERERAFWREEAKKLSDRELLNEIYAMLKTKVLL